MWISFCFFFVFLVGAGEKGWGGVGWRWRWLVGVVVVAGCAGWSVAGLGYYRVESMLCVIGSRWGVGAWEMVGGGDYYAVYRRVSLCTYRGKYMSSCLYISLQMLACRVGLSGCESYGLVGRLAGMGNLSVYKITGW